MPDTFVVVGAGQCAGQAVMTLRDKGFEGRIVLIGEEPWVPYQRPPLSKQFLSGEQPLERMFLKPPKFYDENNVDLMLETRAEGFDRQEGQVYLGQGKKVQYDKLLLATGSAPRKIDLPGADLQGVHYLRTIADVQRIQPSLAEGRKLMIVGGGYIGLEVAAAAITAGADVTVVEMADRVMARVTSPQISEFFAEAHRKQGVQLHCNAGVSEFQGSGSLDAVRCDDQEFKCDAAIVGVGIVPREELARDAGLSCDNGIVVDERCQTEDPNVYAAGDCTNHPNPLMKRRLRLESVHNATEQGKTAAANMCGQEEEYAQIPWFWSTQYKLRLQTCGLFDDHDEVIQRGDPKDDSFALFYMKAGIPIAVDAVSMPREFMACRKLIPQQKAVDADKLADTSIPMQDFV